MGLSIRHSKLDRHSALNVLWRNFTEPQGERLEMIPRKVLELKNPGAGGSRAQVLNGPMFIFRIAWPVPNASKMEAMRKPLALAAGLFAASLFAQNIQPPHTTLKEGDMAPDFTLPSEPTGAKVTLSSFRGKNTVVLAFFPAAFTGG